MSGTADSRHVEVMEKLGNMDGKLDGVMRTQDIHRDRMNHHSGRLGKVERSQSRLKGGVAVLAFVMGVMGTVWGIFRSSLNG
jgi:hypothetical protein